MKNNRIFLAISAVALVLGITACPSDSGGDAISKRPVSGVSLDKPTITLIVGGATETLGYTIQPYNATNKNVTWKSSDSAVAAVSPDGVVTGKSVGNAIITVKTVDGGLTDECIVTVNNAPGAVTGVSLNKTATTLIVGGTEKLFAEIKPDDARREVTWSSSKDAVATVSRDGEVTGKSAGEAIITVTTLYGNKTDSCTVTVLRDAVSVTDISLNKRSTVIFAGYTEKLTETITPPNATNQKVIWSSSDDAVALVSEGGVVTGVSAGTVTITVTAVDGGKTASCTVPSVIPPFL